MNEQKSLVLEIVEAIDHHLRRREPQQERATSVSCRPGWLGRQLAPNLGSVLLVLVLLSVFPGLAAPLQQSLTATSTSTISYQGRLADNAGNPLTGKYNLEFRIYDVPTSGTPLWTEMWTGANAVDISDGLFNVMLGSIDNTLASSIEGYDELYLGITVGTDSEMEPRVQLGSVPFSMHALTVPDGAITQAKAPSLVKSFTNNTKIIYSQVDVTGDGTNKRNSGNISLSQAGFTTSPTCLCSLDSASG